MIKRFSIDDDFFGRYEKLVKEVVIPYQEKALNDEIPDAEKSHSIENYRLAAEMLETGKCDSEFYGMVFQDSDVAKWLEAAAYSLELFPDEELEKRCDAVIDLIGRAQHKDGYLNTYFTVKEPEKRWTNLREAHELYCAGHMMEAAVAYAESTGKKKLLDIMCGMTDHIYKHFIEEKAPGYPGHPEVELALMRMYRCTGNEKYRELAEHFVNVRGEDPDYFPNEYKEHNWTVWGNDGEEREYFQCAEPVRKQKKATGHAVRAVYLYTGMADLAASTGDESLKEACRTLWDNITKCRMYVTGGIGSAYEGEAFTEDYHLPNDTAYTETCAAIGLIFFARKMLDLEIDSRYGDVMERALYNGMLAGMQLDGKRFFYVNPLESLPGISGVAKTHLHALAERPKWFACACCPPNVARLIPSIARYAWGEKGDTVYSHLYIGGTLAVSEEIGGSITVETGYPYDGKVVYHFAPEKDSMKMTLAVRLPSYSRKNVILLNGREAAFEVKDGYAYIAGPFTGTDVVSVEFDMSVRRVFAAEQVSADSGKLSFLRGPLVYCAEGADNDGAVLDLRVKRDGAVSILPYNADKLNGIVELKADGYRIKGKTSLYSFERPKAEPYEITLVPYYTWGNRGINEMRVWLPEM